MSASLTAWLRLTLTPGLGPAAQRNLLAAFGLPEQVFSASHASLVPVIGPELARTVLAPPDLAAIDTALAWSEAPDHYILTLADHEYPRALLDTPDPPTLLYVIGQPALLQAPGVAVVGARSATPQGAANAQAFAQALADAALGIVSGLALGIDTAAHQGALASAAGHTIAVIGTGADRVYPARNRNLAHRIAERGAIISEFPLGTPPLPHHFPRRNRILAGLSRGVLVVEAAVGSGSLITARLAGEYGREVFAIPGSIHSPLSRGCHRLIREGAKLVETAQDVLEELGLPAPARAPARSGGGAGRRTAPTAATTPALFDPVDAGSSVKEDETDDDTARLLAAMGHDPVDIDTLAARSGLTLDALYAILLPLELDGRIGKLPGGRFQRL